MFELHFDGAQIGPSSLDFTDDTAAIEAHASGDEMKMDTETNTEMESEPETEMESEPETAEGRSGRGRFRTLLTLVGVVSIISVVGIAARRFRSDGEDLEIEIGPESDGDVIEEQA
ncbi:hypothetical protein AArcSl_0185 [Halalkaliarchaeum desulfuricum]|uniref:Uncharacterized protein n=2 Tax=Halalkaliarchaeum desulfuricum TaxID=2055893 RepID=A0A343TFG8_9EURY|nr:hypothetical protein AArcSl_0185 [Halalkaliarchaeum desulfuricum]